MASRTYAWPYASRSTGHVKPPGPGRGTLVFVDPGEPRAALADWRARFGRTDWALALAAGSIVRDYRVQYLDTKYLLDSNGVIRTVDYTPLQEASWERDLRAVLRG